MSAVLHRDVSSPARLITSAGIRLPRTMHRRSRLGTIWETETNGGKMRYEEFISSVAERSGLFAGDAVAVTRATLTTLAERISGGEARDLAAELPSPLQDALLPTEEEAEAFSFDEFIDRVAERSGRDAETAETAVDAVMATIHDAVTQAEFDDVLSQLPTEFQRLGAR
ncbi:DUF2267 domain-containing protein [Mycobacterium senriense]|nr:DUF2267 domain-containing protein [Mycobacterium senriense]